MSILLRVRLLSSRKHLRALELDEHPATPGLPAIATPRTGDPWIVNTLPSRRHLTLPWPPDSPATPDVPTQTGYFPGSTRVEAHYSSFKRTHLHAPYPPQYNVAPGPAAQPFTAYDISHRKVRRWPEIAAHLQRTTLGVYKDTPASLYTGEYPAGFATQKAHRVWFERKHLTVPMPDSFPATDTTEAIIPAYFAPKQHERHEKRKIVHLPRLDQYTRTIQSPAAYAPITTIRRRDTARIIQFPLQLDERPVTPPTPAQPATAFQMPVQYRRHGWSNIVVLAEYPDRQVATLPSVRPAVTSMWYLDLFRKRA